MSLFIESTWHIRRRWNIKIFLFFKKIFMNLNKGKWLYKIRKDEFVWDGITNITIMDLWHKPIFIDF